MTVLGETVQFSISNALLLPSAAYIEDYISDLDQYMEEFFEVESVLYLGRDNAEEDSMFWDNLLIGKDAADVGKNTWMLKEVESRGCEEELEWFDSLLIEEGSEKAKEKSTYEFTEMLEKEAPRTATEKEVGNSKEGEMEIRKVELKELPSHLKYVFLGENNTFPVIIVARLEVAREEKLVSMLSQKRKAIGWGIHDIVGISPTMCMHRIELDSGAKPVRNF